MLVRIRHPERLIYPESDGTPMGENSVQFQWVVSLFTGLDRLYRDRADVVVAGDLFWYPVEHDPTTVTAPDLMVIFGRPKRDRPSYKQWEEGGVAPQVVFEIRSPGNTTVNLADRFKFFRRYGAEEYYLYDPATHVLQIWQRAGKRLVAVRDVNGYVSPRMGLRFEVSEAEPMRVIRPDGEPLPTYQELARRAEQEQRRAEQERQRAEAERQAAAAERQRSAALAAKLRELGGDPDAV